MNFIGPPNKNYRTLKHTINWLSLGLFIILFGLSTSSILAQNDNKKQARIDSLKTVIETAEHDSIIIQAWVNWDNMIWKSDPDLSWELNDKIEALCSSHLAKSLSEKEYRFFLKYKSFAYNSKGILAKMKGDYSTALKYYYTCLEIREELDNQKGIATIHNNLGSIYFEQKNFEGALKHYKKSLRIKEKLGNKRGTATTLNNIGNIYHGQQDYDQALNYYRKSLKIRKSIEDLNGMASSLNNIGIIYDVRNEYDSAIVYYNEGLKIGKQTGNKNIIANSLKNIGQVHNDMDLYKKSIPYLEEAHQVALDIEDIATLKQTSRSLSKAYNATGRYKEAYRLFNFFVIVKDSMINMDNQRELLQLEYTKQHLSDSLGFIQQQELDEMAHQAEMDKEANKRYLLYAGVIFLLILGGSTFAGYRRKKKDNILIKQQKQEARD